MSQPAKPTGSIYDLGYRPYEGARLGRSHALQSLYWFSLRGAFGIGRRPSSKIIPIAIAIIAAIPALIQLGIAAIVATGDITPIKPENYFGFIQIMVALFCAAVGPEVMGRDQRTRTLPLYFSRALSRRDYVLGKLLALATALLVLTLVPQLLLFTGSSLASSDAGQFWRDNWVQLPETLASGVLVALLFASLSLLVAAQTSRRAYATVAIVALFIVSSVIAGIVNETTGGISSKIAVLVAPFEVTTGAIFAIYRVAPDTGSIQAVANLPDAAYLAVTVAATIVAAWLVVRRYERLAL